MAVSPAMFLFEVVVESVKSLVESRHLVIRSDFGDIFSLELKDPKQMHIQMPEPLPLPPEPQGKKGKKKPKPKLKKGKKGKGKVEAPPPEPVIQSGQSVLFSSTAEFLIQTMKKFPLELSVWSKEDNYTHIGSTQIPWDPIFLTYLQKICNCEKPPPVTLNEEYNIFQEGLAKLMAKVSIQVKLSFLSDKVTTTFRTLSEDPTMMKVLYTGINSKTTSYMCTMKTTDEDFEKNCNKIESNYVKDKPKSNKIAYADYKNAPGANLTFFKEGDYCCMNNADKPHLSIYKSPETCPDIDFIIDYVRKIIVSCNDNMRMLTPRPVIKPRVKATDIDKLCYCKETNWPNSEIAERFKKEVQSEPCPVCIDVRQQSGGPRSNTFDTANLRGPCGRPDCRIAREMRAYIENLVDEDNKEININDVIGPCGSKQCTLAERIKEILRHEGAFTQGSTLEGLSTQCACVQQLQQALEKKESCDSSCSKDCEESDSEKSDCRGKSCPFRKEPPENRVYQIYHFTIEHDFDKNSSGTTSPSNTYKYCSTECPSSRVSNKTSCSKSICSTFTDISKVKSGQLSQCQDPVCPTSQHEFPAIPADSDIIVHFDKIQNPCGVKSCDVAEKVKDLIEEGIINKQNKTTVEDLCYCDCVCDFNFSRRTTTYCAVCGGYECLGDDVKEIPEYRKPHPCPVYHKMYDKKLINVQSPWPDELDRKQPPRAQKEQQGSKKGSHTSSKSGQAHSDNKKPNVNIGSIKNTTEKKAEKTDDNETTKTKNLGQKKKKIGKFTANVDRSTLQPTTGNRTEKVYPYPPVPKYMGWNWTAEDIPGMKPRPKWKPGATNKMLVRRYRALKDGVDIIAKKKRAMMQKKKKLEMKPTLVITKHKGEYKVQMEVFKAYSKERLLYQYPYDEKPPLVYTIGKTEEEKRRLQKQQERRERRETRRKSRLLQSTFRDRCQEICLKAYNQAIGLLPLPNQNDPDCPCQTAEVQNFSPSINSCSCSEDGSISSSDTDDDEWVIQFTPPVARWDAKAKHPPVLADSECQYNYLDYKVKLLDKSGNPVPRYFKGPDGKQECSDLGGFWGPGHIWMEINKDGYIGPDNRWVPINFIGPDGMYYSAEEGGFTDNIGRYLKIGVDGYIDKDGKWAWYSKNRTIKSPKSRSVFNTSVSQKRNDKISSDKHGKQKCEIKSTFPTKPNKASGDKKQPSSPIDSKVNNSTKDKVKKSVSYSTTKGRMPLVMNASVNYERGKLPQNISKTKATSHSKNYNKYREIMQQLEMCDDVCDYKPVTTTNRASNTIRKVLTPFTMRKNRFPENCDRGEDIAYCY